VRGFFNFKTAPITSHEFPHAPQEVNPHLDQIIAELAVSFGLHFYSPYFADVDFLRVIFPFSWHFKFDLPSLETFNF
jgi:hypothetical protein